MNNLRLDVTTELLQFNGSIFYIWRVFIYLEGYLELDFKGLFEVHGFEVEVIIGFRLELGVDWDGQVRDWVIYCLCTSSQRQKY